MKLKPVLFLAGADPLQRRLILEEVRSDVFPNGSGGLNDDTLDVKERELADVLDLANTLPMLGSRRLILLHNAESPNDDDQELWASYLSNPAPHTTVVVLADKIDKRTRFFKLLEKHQAVVLIEPPKPRELPNWIDKLAKRHGVMISAEARSTLAESVGVDLAAIDNNLEKLALYIHPKEKIEESDVDELVLQSTGDNIFAWTDQVLEGRKAEALNTLHHLMDDGTPPLVLVSMLARHVRLLIRTHQHLSEKIGRAQLAPALGLPPFVVDRYLDQARRLSPDRLRRSLSELQTLDHDLKSTGHPSHFLLEQTIRAFAPD
ncbi:MAG TPA: DNA polymerase III subunit delta [Bdellovibrionota bacterium]|nr:DNA polymerase III subunit delta [Bdellovibrionota bacterium]